MHLVIDLQGCQTESRYRGVGRYAKSLTLAIVRNNKKHKISLVLNSAFPESILYIKKMFNKYIPDESIYIFDCPLPVQESNPENYRQTRVGEKIREHVLKTIKPDFVLLTSLFEGYCDNSITSIGHLYADIKTAVILYDLIPLNNPEQYLETPEKVAYYNRKIDSLKRADLFLSISNCSRDEAINLIGTPPDKIVNISAAIDCEFKNISINPDDINQLRKKYNIENKYILYVPGGSDARKNFKNLLLSFNNLPQKDSTNYQLVIASRLGRFIYEELLSLGESIGLPENRMILTDYLTDYELKLLYSYASLCVFPSLHEGFCLPVLEAMSCGVPVIGSNTTSIPEVIGNSNALFNPENYQDISKKIMQVISDISFSDELSRKGLIQAKKFTWDDSSSKAMCAIENFYNNNLNIHKSSVVEKEKTFRLAFVSPFPPQQTGISSYSVQLLLELKNIYKIDLISNLDKCILPHYLQNLNKRSISWFEKNHSEYDRIVYNIGNSPFHSYMLELLNLAPGIVVLHDFFVSGMMQHEESIKPSNPIWGRAVYTSHGYSALRDYASCTDLNKFRLSYPCNLDVIQQAKGVIVHSEYSKNLAIKWYGKKAISDWDIVPLVREINESVNKKQSRKNLNIPEDDFLVCSFGLIDPIKLNLTILDAWGSSKLSKNKNCRFVFVGQNHGGDYGEQLSKKIRDLSCLGPVKVTGWVEDDCYNDYLAASDLAIQLRSFSQGETSAAILDCMNNLTAVVTNQNNSIGNLGSKCIYSVAEDVVSKDLVKALEFLYFNESKRNELSLNSKNLIDKNHNPKNCANLYKNIIEKNYASSCNLETLLNSITKTISSCQSNINLMGIAQSIAISLRDKINIRQIFIDVTTISKNDLKTGIQRVVREELFHLISSPPQGFRIEPVYISREGGRYCYRYARSYVFEMLGVRPGLMPDSIIDVSGDDILYILDYAPSDIVSAYDSGLLLRLKSLGVKIFAKIYDLLPVINPSLFPNGSEKMHSDWLNAVSVMADAIICISDCVVSDYVKWMNVNDIKRFNQLEIFSAHLGSNIISSPNANGQNKILNNNLKKFFDKLCFIMVGTVEPRKGHIDVIQAFEALWEENIDINLLIVGSEGWVHLPNRRRGPLPKIIDKINSHIENGKHLFWEKNISDDYLAQIYSSATCLITASVAEGFGLPIVEAAKFGLPIIARDLPIFREVAGANVNYFNGRDEMGLYICLKKWLDGYKNNCVPDSKKIKVLNWEDAVHNIKNIFLKKVKPKIFQNDLNEKKAIDVHLNLIHEARVEMVKTLLPKSNEIIDLGGANSPLYKMGYSYNFKNLVLVDLPCNERHGDFQDIEVDTRCSNGNVQVMYMDMTNLKNIDNESFDFVWSGQSIEHVSEEKGRNMCREAYRVLKKGGVFCLDTPNRRLTKIHTKDIGGGFIHPEHCIEYEVEDLQVMLKVAGFSIKRSYVICEMPKSIKTGNFCYTDFMFGDKISNNVADSYIQFHHCVKPLTANL